MASSAGYHTMQTKISEREWQEFSRYVEQDRYTGKVEWLDQAIREYLKQNREYWESLQLRRRK